MEKIKLYTEEQVKEFLKEHTFIREKVIKNMISNSLIPIELPSDEEIEKASAYEATSNKCKTDNWIEGAKWMKEQIKKQIK